MNHTWRNSIRFDPSPDARIGRTHDLRRGIEQLEDALARGHGGLQDVVLVAQVLDGPPEALRIHVEHGQHADGHRARQHAEAAAPDHQRDGHRRQQIDRRIVERVGEDRVFERDHVLAVDVFKVVEGALLAVEQLHHAMPLMCSWVKLLMRAMAARTRR